MTPEQLAAAQGGHDHDHEHGGSGWNLITTFFASTTGLLLVMLAFSAFVNRKGVAR